MTEIVLGSLLFTAIVVGLGGLVMAARAVLLPSREVTITVNGSREVQGRTGQKLLQVLDRAGIALPSACGGAGTCGLCRATIEDGATEPLPTEVNRLTRQQVLAGMRLACQVVLRGDMAVGVPEEVLEAETLEATVSRNRSIAPMIKELVLDLPPDSEMETPAGAFMQLTAPPFDLDFTRFEIDERFEGIWQHLDLHDLSVSSAVPVTRAYSIANRPQDSGCLVFNIRLALPPPHQDVPPGIVSSYLFGLKPGDRIAVAGPYGNFRAQDTDREMVFIGGGVGMAPLRAIIFDQLERIGTDRQITFWYGARSLIELFYADEFDDLAARHENFDWAVALSDPAPDDDWQGPTGFIHEVVFDQYLKDHPAPEECEYYLCGPPLMIKAVYTMLDNLGVGRDNIYFDDFGG